MKSDGEFRDYLESLNIDEASRAKLHETTTRILSRTELLEDATSINCQLVVGEVQSGKTMSFTALIALAHDNNFPIVVVLAGTKDTLLTQTSKRLIKDLKADGNGGANPWVIIEKPRSNQHDTNLSLMRKSLSIWNNANAPQEFKSTVVITTLKNKAGMDEVSRLIADLSTTLQIDKHPVLIIDDEGDEAGLNLSWGTDEESTVYSAIKNLRSNFPKHSYVMYTATPQGPLLIAVEDTLSPKYVTVLASGADYLGGEDLFLDDESKFSLEIPASESAVVYDATKGAAAPHSLKSALAYYLLALYVAQSRGNPKPLSMLVHPSVSKDLHMSYKEWVDNILDVWRTVFANPEEPIYHSEKEKYFKQAEVEIRKTVSLSEDWDLDFVLEKLQWWITKIETHVSNSDNSDIDPKNWLSKAGWILIGGNKLSRGFTIENLAVTYMPRPVGIGNADVIQQRGRFFGYKKKYRDLLRGWFFQNQIEAYSDYVTHEKIMRKSLIEIDNTDQELSSWRRRFLLDPAYSPVRQQIVSLQVNHQRLSLFKQQRLYDPSLPKHKNEILNRIEKLGLTISPMPQDKRSSRKNFAADLTLENAFDLLVDFPMNEIDRRDLDEMLWAARVAFDLGLITKASLVLMDYEKDSKTLIARKRSLMGNKVNPNFSTSEQCINNLFQGPDQAISVNYPGDTAMKVADSMTIQLHLVDAHQENGLSQEALAIAVLMPSGLPGFITERV